VKAKHLLLLAAASLMLIGCQEQPSAPSGNEVFRPNPQIIPEQEVVTLAIGSAAPDFNLPGVDGRFHTLDDFSESKILVVVFTTNHCPTAQAYEDRLIQLAADYPAEQVQLVAISPNSTVGLLYEELGYSDMGDSFEEMILRAEDRGFSFPYLYDGDTHGVSLQYGPMATPHAYVFDADRKLTYTGRIDASEKPGTGQAEDLRAAIDATLAGKPVAEPVTKTFGCSIKWSWKNQYAERVNREWAELPVTIEPIDEAGVAELMRNDSDQLRLVNIWATWCGPCRIEYPEFVEIHRMFKDRMFEFVSVSADSEDAMDEVMKFLEKHDSALENRWFTGGDPYALIELVDPEWGGALPYTALIEPGGKVVYRVMGPIDPQELKTAIVEHPMIGRYY
jgi:thiol-disulfide isomerase/thioredoxin